MSIISFPKFTSKVLTIKEGNFFERIWIRFFQDIWRRVGGAIDLKIGGIVNNDTTQIGNIGSGEDDLMIYTLPASFLKNSGDLLEIIAFGTLASNNNSKTIRLKFGSQTIYTTAVNTANSGAWYFKALIFRTAPTVQKIIVTAHSSNTTLQDDNQYSANFTIGSQDLDTNLVIKCTGQGSSTNDIVQEVMIIKYYSNE